MLQQSLLLNGLELYVTLGCSDEEKSNKQMIKLDLELSFDDITSATNNDILEGTICYYTLRNDIQKFCDGISCNLIEYLTKQIYNFITELHPNISVKYIRLIKSPPMGQIETASFIIRT
jgi:dihydroneopterin aldolase